MIWLFLKIILDLQKFLIYAPDAKSGYEKRYEIVLIKGTDCYPEKFLLNFGSYFVVALQKIIIIYFTSRN